MYGQQSVNEELLKYAFLKEKVDAPFYIQILERYLLPFIQSNFSVSHRFMPDNDPKHTSRVAKELFDLNIRWPTTAIQIAHFSSDHF